jgi:methylenetetrahydrofolate reductase (NADPH)
VPPQIAADLEAMKDDEEKVKEYGVEHGVNMCKELIEGGCKFLHFYTMNLEGATVKIIKGLGIEKTKDVSFEKGYLAELWKTKRFSKAAVKT